VVLPSKEKEWQGPPFDAPLASSCVADHLPSWNGIACTRGVTERTRASAAIRGLSWRLPAPGEQGTGIPAPLPVLATAAARSIPREA